MSLGASIFLTVAAEKVRQMRGLGLRIGRVDARLVRCLGMGSERSMGGNVGAGWVYEGGRRWKGTERFWFREYWGSSAGARTRLDA